MMRTALLVLLLSVTELVAQPRPIPLQLKSARTVLIVNKTGDPNVLGSIRHLLVGSRFTCVDDRKQADLILEFGRIVSANDPSVTRNAISISVRNVFTLDVLDRGRNKLWSDTAELIDADNGKPQRHPTTVLMNEFLDISAK